MLLVLLTSGCALVSRFGTGFFLTPLTIFVAANSLSLASYHLRLLDLREVSARTHLVVVLALVAFFFGFALAAPRKGLALAAQRERDTRGLGGFFYLTSLLSLVGWLVPLAILLRRYGSDQLARQPSILQNDFQMQFLGYLNVLGIAVLPAFVAKWHLARRRAIDMVLVTSSLVGLFLAGIKQFIFFSVFVAYVTLSILRPGRVRLRHCVLGAVVGLAFFVFYNHVVDVGATPIGGVSHFPGALRWMERPYLYLVGSWPAMEQASQGAIGEPPVAAYVTLQPLWKILGDGLHLVKTVPPYLPFADIGCSPFNVFSFAGELYWDLGLLGMLVVSSLVGFFSTELFIRGCQSRSWFLPLTYGLFAYVLAISFFAYYVKFMVVVLLLYVIGAGSFLRLLSRVHRNTNWDAND